MISSSEGSRPVPVIALGTATELSISGVEVVTPSTLIEAMKMGYRHFDTAAIYQTEKPVGEAVAEAIRLGLIKSRSEVFITAKMCNMADRHLVLPAIKQSLKNLGLESVDLYRIHFPISLRWLYEQGVIIAIKSFNTKKMKQNLEIFDWSLTQVELNKIDQIPQRRHAYLSGSMSTGHNDILAKIDAELD
ncbi:hypothetical protein R6Q57_019773 [Mikania cordata]